MQGVCVQGVCVECWDHLRIVAGLYREIGLAEHLNGRARPSQQHTRW